MYKFRITDVYGKFFGYQFANSSQDALHKAWMAGLVEADSATLEI